MERRTLLVLLFLAALLTFLNSLKPLHMDDGDYYSYATQIASAPLDDLKLRCEQAIRNYDPCISCAAHFLKLQVHRT